MPFPWRWNGGTISTVLDVIWGMSVGIDRIVNVPDGGTELCCPAQRVGQEDRVGEEAEEAGPEEAVTTAEVHVDAWPTLHTKAIDEGFFPE